MTKDSGIEGSIREKVEVALNNGVKVIVINRLKVNYIKTFDDIEESKVLNNHIIMRASCLLNYSINRKYL